MIEWDKYPKRFTLFNKSFSYVNIKITFVDEN